jgi:hypothetical protein
VPVSHRNYFLKSPLYMAFPIAADPADRAVGPLSPLPCQAWHGYAVSSAHHGEVRGCRRAYERTPIRGRRRCAAGGRIMSSTFCSGDVVAVHPSNGKVMIKLVTSICTLPCNVVLHDNIPHTCDRNVHNQAKCLSGDGKCSHTPSITR